MITKTVRYAAIVTLLATQPGQAQTGGQSVCTNVWDGYSKYERVCSWEAYAPTVVNPPEPEYRRGPGTEETVYYDPAAEARKRQAAGLSLVSDLCVRPYRMTERDGCQPPAGATGNR